MKLSRIVITLMFVAIIGMVLSAPELYAYPVSVGQSIYFEFAYGNEYRPNPGPNGRGGAFGVYDYNSTNFLFNTFCLETNEFIYLSNPYHVGSITGVAIANNFDPLKGYQSALDGDPLDSRTAYLYSRFMAGTLNFHGNNMTDPRVANALQRAIWFIEQEYGNTNADWSPNWSQSAKDTYLGSTSDPTGLLAQQFFDDANANNNGTLYNVQVINVIDGNRQDMLVVPEPGVLILLCISLSSVGLAARRYRLMP